MAAIHTESLHPMADGLDLRPSGDILALLLEAQKSALDAMVPALPAIEKAADLMAGCMRREGRLVYAGAGSSALMAMADALELPGTFGIAPDRIRIAMAGGMPRDSRMTGDTEDDAAAGTAEGQRLGPADLVIAVTASGRTPYPVALTRAARNRGARVIAVANAPSAPVFEGADVAILLATPPEPVAGSTRLGAGTAQKVALNLISTLAAIRLGLVHDGMMVALVADNDKLRTRAAGMVSAIAGADAAAAGRALAASGGDVRIAVLVAGGLRPEDAVVRLRACDGNLRAALARGTDDRRPAPAHEIQPRE